MGGPGVGALLVLLTAFGQPHGLDCDHPERLRPERRVARIQLDGADHCSATILAPDRILTSHHCVQLAGAWTPIEADRLTVETSWGGRSRIGAIRTLRPRYQGLGELSGSDLALLEVDPLPGVEGLASLVRRPEPGVCAYLVVDRNGRQATLSAPVLQMTATTLQTSEITEIGDSGAPVFTEDGSLLGVASWRARGWSTRRYSVFNRVDVHATWIRDNMAGAVPDRTPPGGLRAGQQPEPRSQDARR